MPAHARARPVLRAAILIHRYLGIGLGVLMSLWCLSGIVMMYVPYPHLEESDRLAGLPPINWSNCCVFDGQAASASARVSSFQLEMLGDVPVLRLALAEGGFRIIDLAAGRALPTIGREDAWYAAARFAGSRYLTMRGASHELIDHDQWTVGGSRSDRPLHHIAFNDPDGTEVYVSSHTGKIVQVTTRRQRFWNWLGAVPHWLYPSVLREHPQVWTQVLVWASLLGSFLTAAGLFVGIAQLRRRRRDGALASPYRGILYWHHVPGLIFGVFVLTWVVSGLLSMNPWGLMEGGDIGGARDLLAGKSPTVAQVRASIGMVPRNSPSGVVSIRSAPLDGELFAVSSAADGSRRRFDSEGNAATLLNTDIDAAARRLAGGAGTGSWTAITDGDAYHYSVGNQRALLPAIRVNTGGASAISYYLDPLTAELNDVADSGTRAYRWWHSGLHRLDFVAPLRAPGARNFLMLPLLLGAATVCVIGAYLGMRRLIR